MLKAIPDGAVELYHDNVKRFETVAAGARVTGRLGIEIAPSTAFEAQLNAFATTGNDVLCIELKASFFL